MFLRLALLRIIKAVFLLAAAVSLRAEAQLPARRMANDGSAQAPKGIPLLPTLLRGYAIRPSWKVAGVDYAVGVPSGMTLKDPAMIAVAGVSVNAVTHILNIDASNVTLDGYDFGFDGGWGIYIRAGVTNAVVQNSHFLVGANNVVPINAGGGAGNLTVRCNAFDGGRQRSDKVWALINYNGSGTFIAQYNSFLDAPSDAIDFSAGTMRTIVTNNVFENLGTSPGSHPDSVQYVGVNANNSVIAFNTIYQPNPSGMQGIQLAAQNGSTLTDTFITNNVIVAKKSPAQTMSYSIAIQQGSGNTIIGVTVSENYIDFSGAWGPFYRPSGNGLVFDGNMDMVTGVRILPPAGAASR